MTVQLTWRYSSGMASQLRRGGEGCEKHHEKREQDDECENESADADGCPAVTRPSAETPLQQDEHQDDCAGNHNAIFPEEQRRPAGTVGRGAELQFDQRRQELPQEAGALSDAAAADIEGTERQVSTGLSEPRP